jgi:hypothetical protein
MARLDGQRFAELATSILDILKTNKFANESFQDAFIRLIGLIPNVDSTQVAAQAGDLSTRTSEKLLANFDEEVTTGQGGETVVDGLFKSSDANKQSLRLLIGSYVDNLLTFVDKWNRQQRGQQARRLQRLVGNIADPFDPTLIGRVGDISLHSSVVGANEIRSEVVNIGEVIRQVNQGLKEIELSKSDRSIGTLTLQASLFELVLTQLNLLISAIPVDKLGQLGGVVTNTIKTPVIGIEDSASKIGTQRRAVGVELARLQEQEALIITGVNLETNEVLSLKNFLQGLSFLTNKVQYKCKECKFFQKGGQISQSLTDISRENPTQGTICTFSFQGKTGLPTQENFSCKEVWGLINNDFWTASLDVINQFVKAFLAKDK